MSIYAGVNGVARKIPDVHIGGGYGHALKVMAGVNGVAREVWTRVDELDHVEIRVMFCGVSDGGSTVYSTNSKSYLQRYGSYTVGSDCMSVSCSIAGRYCYIQAHLYLVAKDGCAVWFPDTITRIGGKEVIANVYSTQGGSYSGSTSGTWSWRCRHGVWVFANDCARIYYRDGVTSNWASGNDTKTWGGDANKDYFQIGAGPSTSSTTAYTKMTFSSITIGGKSFPIVLRDELTG